MCKPEKVQKKKISLTKLLVFRLCVNTSIKNILGFCWDVFFLQAQKGNILFRYLYICFHSSKNKKPQRFPLLDVETYLIKRYKRSLVVGYAFIINKLVTKFIFFSRKKGLKGILTSFLLRRGECIPFQSMQTSNLDIMAL